ncbi:DUF3515 domain-containing protein [Streptomyces sp. NPDC001678]|uniref:DUF3515 domain-containing protein n=1 Tax=Streptomyces sp. NPDC001678 TaxID=3364599 RepID=UPI003681E253
MKSRRGLLTALPAVAAILASVGCSADDEATNSLPAPTPSGRQSERCHALRRELPGSLDDRKRTSDPKGSDFMAAWGKPAIVLRCGVQRPLVLTPGYKRYNPYAPTVEINGVEWMPEEQPDGSVRCTTSKREAWVEVTLPKSYAENGGQFGVLADLSGAVAKSIPFGIV